MKIVQETVLTPVLSVMKYPQAVLQPAFPLESDSVMQIDHLYSVHVVLFPDLTEQPCMLLQVYRKDQDRMV